MFCRCQSSSAGKKRLVDLKDPNSDYETLFLPPTKLQIKSRRLRKLYEKQQLHRRPSTSHPGRRNFKLTTDKGDPELEELTSYARNKLNNSKSHIALPTYDSGASTLDSPALEPAKPAAAAMSTRPKTAAIVRTAPPRQYKSEKEREESRNADVGVQVEHGEDVSINAPSKSDSVVKYNIHALTDKKVNHSSVLKDLKQRSTAAKANRK